MCLSVFAGAQTDADSTTPPARESQSVRNIAKVSPDSSGTAKDTVKKPFQPNPKKAGLYSALLPGTGQIYNRQYWKAPVIYAAFGAAGYIIASNYKQYNRYRSAYILEIDKNPNTINPELYGEVELKQLRDQYKQWLDMTVLLTSLAYMVQVMDAVVFAHLKNFDVSPDISMRMQPVAMPSGGLGFGLAFHLK